MAVASSNASHLIATSCKATTPQHAVVRLYSTNDWRPFERTLAGHSLTVTRIAFSQNDELIVTVGRDRGWCLFAKDKDGRGVFRAHPFGCGGGKLNFSFLSPRLSPARLASQSACPDYLGCLLLPSPSHIFLLLPLNFCHRLPRQDRQDLAELLRLRQVGGRSDAEV